MDRETEFDAFRDQCGPPSRLVIQIEGPGSEGGEVHEFDQPFVVIGRSPKADLVLRHPQVGLRHAYFQVLDGRLFVVDLHSPTGTWLDDWPIAATWLAPGRDLKIGPWRVRQLGPEGGAGADWVPDDPMASLGESQTARPGLGLLERIGPDGVRTWGVRPILTMVGRAWTCRVAIADRGLARHQFALLRMRDRPWVVDLLNRGGLQVNGLSVRAAALEEGDQVSCGRLVLTVRSRVGQLGPSPAAQTRPRNRQVPALAAPPGGMMLPVVTHPFGTTTGTARGPGVSTERDLDQFAAMMEMMTSHFEQSQQQMMGMFQEVMRTVGQTFSNLHDQHAVRVREELEELRKINQEIAGLKLRMLEAKPDVQEQPAAPVFDPKPAEPLKHEATNGTNGTSHANAPRKAVTPRVEPLPPGTKPSDIHASLAVRLATLEQRQQGTWRQLLELMSKRSR